MNDNELKCKCGSTIFNVFTKHNCQTCRFNTDQECIDDNYECEMGDCNNIGCTNIFCAVCGEITQHTQFVEA
jgi:hypothetical protein